MSQETENVPECIVLLTLRLSQLEAENAALHTYCAALNRALDQGRRTLDAQGRAVRKARKAVAEISGKKECDTADWALALQCHGIG
jgi:hypothetical protein